LDRDVKRIGAVLLFVVAGVAAQTTDVPALLRAVDETRNAFDEAIISARAAQLVAGERQGEASFDIYRKGRDRALILFTDSKNRGRKVLTVGEKMWLLVPGARNPVPITANQRLVGGASIGDLARLRFADDFAATARAEPERVGDRSCRVLDLTAREKNAPYPKVVLWVDEREKLPCKVLFFLPSGKPVKEVLFTAFGRSGEKRIVSSMEVHDLLAPQARRVTRLDYSSYRPAKIDDKIFTPQGAAGL
jgi:hypothetical protein